MSIEEMSIEKFAGLSLRSIRTEDKLPRTVEATTTVRTYSKALRVLKLVGMLSRPGANLLGG